MSVLTLNQQLGFGFESSHSNAGAFVSLLKEQDNQLKELALDKLIAIVDTQWSEISEFIDIIEAIYEDDSFPRKDKSAFLCSKVYYHLGDKDEALTYALQSESYFNLDVKNQFNECITWHCVDQYIQFKNQKEELDFPEEKEQMVEKIILSSCNQGNQISAIGIALDCYRKDLVQKIIHQWNYPAKMVQVLQLVNTTKGDFREEILRLCVDEIYNEAKQGQVQNEQWPQFISVLVQLGEVSKVAEILWSLIGENQFQIQNSNLLALQIAIDLADNQRPQFINLLIASLPTEQSKEKEKNSLVKILNGEVQRKAYNYFLKELKQTDPQILVNIKNATDPKFGVPHGGALLAHGLMQLGTQDSQFLKNNIEWATKCNYWVRFTTTATLGLIYRGCYEKTNEVLSSYVPGNSTNVFEQGGAFYAQGLINQGTRNNDAISKMTETIKNPQLNKNEQIIHGACLGLGLIGFATEDGDITSLLKDVLMKNDSVYGEAAAVGLGLIHAGSQNNDLIVDMYQQMIQTEKEKIIRGLGYALAMIHFGREEKADSMIDEMLKQQEPFVRYGACMMIAMAYVGTGSNKMIEKLLHISVEDVADDVRRGSIIALAFVLFKNYEQIPKIVRLLILSYNPHIRYATALALGIACAGTMYQDAISMLEPMISDNVDFVRQAALISLSMVMMQANSNCEPKFENFKKQITEIQAKKHETPLVKFGVFLSQGIIDAGGRNVTIQLVSRQGFPKLDACIGMMLFTNYWYWFPSIPFLSLALTPCCMIGLNHNLDIPKSYQVQCNAKPSMFGYPPHIKAEEKKVVEKKTVKLSTTDKVKAKINKRETDKQGLEQQSSMGQGESKVSLDQQTSAQQIKQTSTISVQGGDNESKMKIEEPPKKEEALTHVLQNPFRVIEKQKKHLQLVEGRYQPLFKERKVGFIMLVDSTPDVQDDVISFTEKQNVPVNQQMQREQQVIVEAPEEFIFDEEAQNEESKPMITKQ